MSETINKTEEEVAPQALAPEESESESVVSGCDCGPLRYGEKCVERAARNHPEAYERWRSVKKEEADKLKSRERIEMPWRYETQKPMTEPPDINYRRDIMHDQENIDELFKDKTLHFTERCLSYQKLDVSLEDEILDEYKWWIAFMLKDAKIRGDETREKFFQDLYQVVTEDRDEVHGEWDKLQGEQDERTRQDEAQRLGIPLFRELWSEEDKRRYEASEIEVTLWDLWDSDSMLDFEDDEEDLADGAGYRDHGEGESSTSSRASDAPIVTKGRLLEDGNSRGRSGTSQPLCSSVDDELSQPTCPTTTAPRPDVTAEGSDAAIKYGLVPHTNDPQSSFTLTIKFRMGGGGPYYRPIAAILLIILLNEVIKQ